MYTRIIIIYCLTFEDTRVFFSTEYPDEYDVYKTYYRFSYIHDVCYEHTRIISCSLYSVHARGSPNRSRKVIHI